MTSLNYSYDTKIPAWLCAGILRLASQCSPFKLKRMAWVHFQYRETQPSCHAWAVTPKPPHRRKARHVHQILHPPRTNVGYFRDYQERCRWWLAWRVSALVHELAHISDAQHGLRFSRHSVPHGQRIQEIRAEAAEQVTMVAIFCKLKHRKRFDRLAKRVASMTDKNWRKA
jgi:hypothetical protein